jgi:hypothetical protein
MPAKKSKGSDGDKGASEGNADHLKAPGSVDASPGGAGSSGEVIEAAAEVTPQETLPAESQNHNFPVRWKLSNCTSSDMAFPELESWAPCESESME